MLNLCNVMCNKKEMLINLDDIMLVQEENNIMRITFKFGMTILVDSSYADFKQFLKNRSGIILTELCGDKECDI